MQNTYYGYSRTTSPVYLTETSYYPGIATFSTVNPIVGTISDDWDLSGFNLFIIVVLPLLSSPRHNILASRFFPPNNADSLSRNPIFFSSESSANERCRFGEGF